MQNQHIRLLRHLRHRCKIPDQVIGQAAVVRCPPRGVRAADHHNGVAVGLSARHGLQRDGAGATGTVVDHHRLAPNRVQFLRHRAHGDVAPTTGSQRNHETHRP